MAKKFQKLRDDMAVYSREHAQKLADEILAKILVPDSYGPRWTDKGVQSGRERLGE